MSTHKKEFDDFLKSVKKRTGEGLFAQKYLIKRQNYLASANVTGIKRGKEISFYYSSSGATLPKKIEPVSTLLKYLSKFGDEVIFLVWASFSYPRDRFEDILSLPITIKEKNFPFDRIEGIRLVKREDDKILVSVIVDQSDKDIIGSVTFEYMSTFSERLPEQMLT